MTSSSILFVLTSFIGIASLCSIIFLIIKRTRVINLVSSIILIALFSQMQLIFIFLLYRPDLAANSDVAMSSGICALIFNSALNIVLISYISKCYEIYEEEKEKELKANLDKLDKKYFETIKNELSNSQVCKSIIIDKLNDIKLNLDRGDINNSNVLLEQINNDVEKIRNIKFCEEPTINMVLTLKTKKADSLSIPLHIKALVPSDIDISKLDLSSVISNMIDNALDAAYEHKKEIGFSQVNISIVKKNNYLVIRTENPTTINKCITDIDELHTTKEQNDYIHGYGLKILNKIAERYNGELTVDINNHKSVFVMILDCANR